MAKKDTVFTVDFSKEESSGTPTHRVPPGDYLARVKTVTRAVSKQGNDMYVWDFVGVEGPIKGKTFRDHTSLSPKALFKLRQVLEAIGFADVPEPGGSVYKFKLSSVLGKPVGITLDDDEYNGRVSSRIMGYVAPDALGEDTDDDDTDEDEDDDETDEVSDDEEDDEEEEDEDDPLLTMDRPELKRYIAAKGLDVRVKKSMDDDDIRDAIREATGDDEIGALELDDEDL